MKTKNKLVFPKINTQIYSMQTNDETKFQQMFKIAAVCRMAICDFTAS